MAEPADRLRAELEALRGASDTTAEDRRPVELDQQSVGRLSRMDALQNQAIAAGTEARRRGRIAAIQAALARVKAGTYGRCVDCEEPIEPGRLTFDPCATLCLDCARG